MTLQQFLLILWARRKVVLLTFFATVLTTLVGQPAAAQAIHGGNVRGHRRQVARPDRRHGAARHDGARLHGHAGRHHQQRPRRATRRPAAAGWTRARRSASSGRKPPRARGRLHAWLGDAAAEEARRQAVARKQRHQHRLHRGRSRPLPPPSPMPLPRPTSIPTSSCASNRQSNTPTGSTARSRCSAKSWKRPRRRFPATSRQPASSAPTNGSTTKPRSSTNCLHN